MKNSNDTIRNRSRDLSVRGAVNTKSMVYIVKPMIMQGGEELTDTCQNTVLPYSGSRGQSLLTKNVMMLRHFRTC
jgi:hypothetical protein